ncbi:MAG TPA: hypothetical protein VF629_19400 [Hymenobacter sp.]|jgi:hypothetical protein|uniref:hypothetical protein n=1 Tax=Hymenobacter sp. TaxID=1898978 RepID=UPI002ED86569
MKWANGTPWFKIIYIFETLSMPLYQTWAYALFALGAYRLAGSLWRGFAIAAVGLLVNSLLIETISHWLVRLAH